MNNGFDKILIIDKEQLKNEFYLGTLIEQAHDKGLLSDNDIERMKYI